MLGLYDFISSFTLSPAWNDLDFGTLKSLLERRVTLTVCCEDAILSSLKDWCMFDADKRTPWLLDLLNGPGTVKIGHISERFWLSELQESSALAEVAEKVLAFQDASLSLCPNGEPITSISFKGYFFTCSYCASESFIMFHSKENAVSQNDERAAAANILGLRVSDVATYCEVCVRERDETMVVSALYEILAKSKKEKRKHSGLSKRFSGVIRSIGLRKRSTQENTENSSDLVYLRPSIEMNNESARRYTWPDKIKQDWAVSSSIPSQSMPSVNTCRLLPGMYYSVSFIGGYRIFSPDIQICVSSHNEVSGSGIDELGHYTLSGHSFGSAFTILKKYPEKLMRLNLLKDEREPCSFIGTWTVLNGTGPGSSPESRQNIGVVSLVRHADENETRIDASTDTTEENSIASSSSCKSTEESKQQNGFYKLLASSDKLRISLEEHTDNIAQTRIDLDLWLCGAQPFDQCPFFHDLELVTMSSSEMQDPDFGPIFCSRCHKALNEKDDSFSEHNLKSSGDSLPVNRHGQTDSESLEDEIAVHSLDSSVWYGCLVCDYSRSWKVCKECYMTERSFGSEIDDNLGTFSTTPRCIYQHSLEPCRLTDSLFGHDSREDSSNQIDMPENNPKDIPIVCEICAINLRPEENVYQCKECESNDSRSRFYCFRCFDTVKVVGVIQPSTGDEGNRKDPDSYSTMVTLAGGDNVFAKQYVYGVVQRCSNALYVVGDEHELKILLYEIEKHSRAIESSKSCESIIAGCTYRWKQSSLVTAVKIQQIPLQHPKNNVEPLKALDFESYTSLTSSMLEHNESVGYCLQCNRFESKIEVEGVLDVLFAAVRDRSVEIQIRAEEFLVENYSQVSQRFEGSNGFNSNMFLYMHRKSFMVAKHVMDRIIRVPSKHRKNLKVLLKDVEIGMDRLCEKAEKDPNLKVICTLGEILGLITTSFRFQLLWERLGSRIKVRLKDLFTGWITDQSNKSFTSHGKEFASSIISSFANVLAVENQPWTELEEIILSEFKDRRPEHNPYNDPALEIVIRVVSKLDNCIHSSHMMDMFIETFARGYNCENSMVAQERVEILLLVFPALAEKVENGEIHDPAKINLVVRSFCMYIESTQLGTSVIRNALSCLARIIDTLDEMDVQLEPETRYLVFDSVMKLRQTGEVALSLSVLGFWTGASEIEGLRSLLADVHPKTSKVEILVETSVESIRAFFQQLQDDTVNLEALEIVRLACTIMNEIIYCVVSGMLDFERAIHAMIAVLERAVKERQDSWQSNAFSLFLFTSFYPALRMFENSSDNEHLQILKLEEEDLDLLEEHFHFVSQSENHADKLATDSSNLEDSGDSQQALEIIEMMREDDRQGSLSDLEALVLGMKESTVSGLILKLLLVPSLGFGSEADPLSKGARLMIHSLSVSAIMRIFGCTNPCSIGVQADGKRRFNQLFLNLLENVIEVMIVEADETVVREIPQMLQVLKKSFMEKFRGYKQAQSFDQLHAFTISYTKACKEYLRKSFYETRLENETGKFAVVCQILAVSTFPKAVEECIDIVVEMLGQSLSYMDTIYNRSVQISLIHLSTVLIRSIEERLLRSMMPISMKALDYTIEICNQSEHNRQGPFNPKSDIVDENEFTEAQKGELEQLRKHCVIQAANFILSAMQDKPWAVWTKRDMLLPLLMNWIPNTSMNVKCKPENKYLLDGYRSNISIIAANICSVACKHASPEWLNHDGVNLINNVIHTLALRDHSRVVDCHLLALVGDLLDAKHSLIPNYIETLVPLFKYFTSTSYLEGCRRCGIRDTTQLINHRDGAKKNILKSCMHIIDFCQSYKYERFWKHLDWLFETINVILSEQGFNQDPNETNSMTLLFQGAESLNAEKDDRSLQGKVTQRGSLVSTISVSSSPTLRTRLEEKHRGSRVQRVHRTSSKFSNDTLFSIPDDLVAIRSSGSVNIPLCEATVNIVEFIHAFVDQARENHLFVHIKEMMLSVQRYIEANEQKKRQRRSLGNETEAESARDSFSDDDLRISTTDGTTLALLGLLPSTIRDRLGIE